MKRILPLLWLMACPKSAPVVETPEVPKVPETTAVPEVPEVPEVEAPALGAPSLVELQKVSRLLSVKDPEPVCAEVEAVIPGVNPVPTYLYVVTAVSMPPYAPMRAAGCLITDHSQAAAGPILSWMTNPNTEGLARLVLAKLDSMPENLAVSATKLGLTGDLSELAAESAAKSAHPAVVALVAE